MITLPIHITKKWIKERVSDEEIFSFYCHDVELGVSFRSPLRNDENPTCNYFYAQGRFLVLVDHSGHFSGNCFDFVMHLYNLSFRETLLKIASDFNLLPREFKGERLKTIQPKIEQKESKIDVTIRDWNQLDLDYWGRFGITPSLLWYFKCGAIDNLWLNDRLHYSRVETNPAYIYVFKKSKKAYFPLRTTYRFLGNSQELQGYEQLPETGDLLIITKSLKDVMVLYNYGVYAVAPQSEAAILTEEQYFDLSSRFKTLVMFYDFDLTGVRSTCKMKRKYDINYIFLTNGRFFSEDHKAKDISEAHEIHGETWVLKFLDDNNLL